MSLLSAACGSRQPATSPGSSTRPPGLFSFFTELQTDNSKSFWQANKHRREHNVSTPMRTLLGELSDEFGPLRMFRPNRDMRFSKDKLPYKLWTGAARTSRT